MTPLYYPPTQNGLQKQLDAQLDEAATTATLNNVTGIQNKPGVFVVNRIDSDGALLSSSVREFVSYTGTSGNTLTGLTRALGGSTDQDHAIGSIVEFIPDITWGQSVIDALKVLVTEADISVVNTTNVVTPTGTQTLTNKTLTSPVLNGTLSGDAFLDEDDMTSNSATKTASQQSIKAYVDASGGGTTDMFQNALINGNFDIWQRATTFTTPDDDTFGPDRWNFLVDGNGAWTFVRDTDVPEGVSTYSLKCTNVTQNKQCGIVQILEGIDSEKFNGKTVSLSFYAKTTGTEIANLRATVLSWGSTADAVTSDVVGTWAGNGTDPTWATNWTAEVAGSNKALTASWQRFTIENISVDTSGMNNLAVVIWTDDTTIAANDDFWITGIQLNTGATATEFMARHYTNELLLCQRYCWVLTEASNGLVGNGRTESTTRALIWLPHPVEMFREPTLTATAGDWQVMHAASTTDCSAVQLFSGGGTKLGTLFGFDVASGLTAGQACQVRADAGGTRVLILNAEL